MRKILIIGGGIATLVLIAIIIIAITMYSNITGKIADLTDITKLSTVAMEMVNNTKEKANIQVTNLIGTSDAQSCEIFNQKLDLLSQKSAEKSSLFKGFIDDQVSSIKAVVEKAPESGKALACQKAADAMDVLLK